MKQTNQIKYHRNEKQQAWNTSVKQCALGERAGLNQKNFQIFFHHASQYRLVHNAYYALLNDYREVINSNNLSSIIKRLNSNRKLHF